MQVDYFKTVSSIISLMKQPNSPCKDVSSHWTCYSLLFKYLVENNIPFSMEAAFDWLEIKKEEVSHASISGYTNALFRLEHYILFGNLVSNPLCYWDSTFWKNPSQN